ncbi:hydantoinase/oxoprolinase family protein [Vibrio sp.]|uniref:Hydantoinase/oxoprolinase family protein n=1 Tax=Vibrio viridaestus TaxID=2487322 RepID=A0A3N9TY90_9VIBR|nr:hydantoinase/oxoprolinase family protein [Vibrio viridaestus]MDC0610237.1 hydantoinase/oxoprolinase family protein [Vibrio sp.]RQW61902.1 hydantoinase/oxoprolinase family protein [Vibrio viridaestus]
MNQTTLTPPFTISVDTGGTFTDLILADQNRVIGLYKSSSTPDDLFNGISASIELAAIENGMTLSELLEDTKVFVYSTTRSTNAVLEGKVAKTAFITTQGFRDVLLYREGGKEDPYNLSTPYPTPYIPRRLTFEVQERVLADGSVAVELDEDSVRSVLQRLKELEVEAIAVCLTFSIANSSHEVRIGEMIEQELPGVAYSLSHQVNNVVREYRRASSTAIDASIKPLMKEHLQSLERRFREAGFKGDPLMVTHVSGGVMSLEQMADKPIQTIDSGPALAPVAGAQYGLAEPLAQGKNIIVVDTGGTSYDVSLTHDGQIAYSREKWLGPEWSGHMTGLPAVDTRSLGAGGGSIAYIDDGGLVCVGPISAGATPGPACYGRGGKEPTVTDAALVLGYLDPSNFLGGRMTLDLEAAREAFRTRLAEPLGISIEESAEAVLRITSEDMRGFTTDMTISQGIDPRDCVMVAGGGAAGMNIVRIAQDLGVEHIIIPRLASGLSAVGGQCTDISATVSAGKYMTTGDFDGEQANEVVQGLNNQLQEFFDDVKNDGTRTRNLVIEARYDQQLSEIDVDLGDTPNFCSADALEMLHSKFDEAHLKYFSVNQPGAPVEIVSWRAEGKVIRSKPSLAMPLSDSQVNAIEPTYRDMFFNDTLIKGAVYRVEKLPSDVTIKGPAVIEEPTTTIVVPPGAVALTRSTHYLISIDQGNKEQ